MVIQTLARKVDFYITKSNTRYKQCDNFDISLEMFWHCCIMLNSPIYHVKVISCCVLVQSGHTG